MLFLPERCFGQSPLAQHDIDRKNGKCECCSKHCQKPQRNTKNERLVCSGEEVRNAKEKQESNDGPGPEPGGFSRGADRGFHIKITTRVLRPVPKLPRVFPSFLTQFCGRPLWLRPFLSLRSLSLQRLSQSILLRYSFCLSWPGAFPTCRRRKRGLR